MKLTLEDQEWLGNYRKALDEQFPGLVKNIFVFGSKARGTATPDSDLDVLVVIEDGDWRAKDRTAAPGHDLAIGSDVVPSIIVLTRSEWAEMEADEAPFWRTVSRDAVVVA